MCFLSLISYLWKPFCLPTICSIFDSAEVLSMQSGWGTLWDCTGLSFSHVPEIPLLPCRTFKRVGVFLWLYHWGFILQHIWSQVLFYKEEKNNYFLELSLFFSLRLQYRVIRILLQLMKARSRRIIGRSNLLRVWSGVRSYHESLNSELHDKPRNCLVEDETNIVEIFD